VGSKDTLYETGSLTTLTPQGKMDLGLNPQPASKCFRITKKWFMIHHVVALISDSTFYRIIMVFVVYMVWESVRVANFMPAFAGSVIGWVFTPSSKRPANVQRLLEVCWTFAGSCKRPINDISDDCFICCRQIASFQVLYYMRHFSDTWTGKVLSFTFYQASGIVCQYTFRRISLLKIFV